MPRNILQTILDPLGGVQFIHVYNQYYPIIDFFVYLILFAGLTRVTLEKRFEGAAGRILSLGVGIVLALALAITEYRMHFNIASFGPMAAIILLSIVGLMFFQFLLSFGISYQVAASFSFIGIYTTIRAFAPSLFDWILLQAPYLAALLSVALLVSMGIIIFHIIPKISSSLPPTSANFQSLRITPDAIPPIKENAYYSQQAEKASYQIQFDEQDAFRRLRQIKQYLPSLIQTEDGQNQLIRALQDTNLQEHRVFQSFRQLQSLDQAIEQGDLSVFQKLSQDIRTGKIPKESLSKIIQFMEDTRKRIDLEKTLNQMDQKLYAIMQRFSQSLQILSQAIAARDGSAAMKAVNSAMSVEREMNKVMEVINVLEKKLQSMFMQALKKAGIKMEKAAYYSSASSKKPSKT